MYFPTCTKRHGRTRSFYRPSITRSPAVTTLMIIRLVLSPLPSLMLAPRASSFTLQPRARRLATRPITIIGIALAGIKESNDNIQKLLRVLRLVHHVPHATSSGHSSHILFAFPSIIAIALHSYIHTYALSHLFCCIYIHRRYK